MILEEAPSNRSTGEPGGRAVCDPVHDASGGTGGDGPALSFCTPQGLARRMRRPAKLLLVLAIVLAIASTAGAIPPEPCTWLGLPQPPCPS